MRWVLLLLVLLVRGAAANPLVAIGSSRAIGPFIVQSPGTGSLLGVPLIRFVDLDATQNATFSDGEIDADCVTTTPPTDCEVWVKIKKNGVNVEALTLHPNGGPGGAGLVNIGWPTNRQVLLQMAGTTDSTVEVMGEINAASTFTLAQLGTAVPGRMTYCNNCNPGSNPCTSGGGGTWAFGIAGPAWKCL